MTSHKKDDDNKDKKNHKERRLEDMADHELELLMAEHASIGLRQAKDGKWYMPDPNRPGRYLQLL